MIAHLNPLLSGASCVDAGVSLLMKAEVSMQTGAHVRAEVRDMQPCPPS